MTTPSSHQKNHSSFWLWVVGGLTGFLCILFYHRPGLALLTMDSPVWLMHLQQDAIRSGDTFYWARFPWLGLPYGTLPPDWNSAILYFFDYPHSVLWLCVFNLLTAGLGMYWTTRVLGLGRFPSLFGAASFMLTNTVVTLIFPGHINKIMTAAWLPFAVGFYLKGWKTSRWTHYIVSGGCLGLAILGGEIQLPYYLGIWFVIGAIWQTVTLWKANPQVHRRLLSPMLCTGLLGCFALFVGFAVVIHNFNYLLNNKPVADSNSAAQTWDFATQYYFPPQEVLSFFTTVQFFGAPQAYWGQDGAPYPIRFSDDYMGLLPLVFGILGGIFAWKKVPQVRFFVVMAVGSLLASFGKYGFVYALLYQLPTMKSQRNPHRWSYFVALAVCVLAAYGMDWFLKQLEEKKSRARLWILLQRGLVILSILGVLFALACWVTLNSPSSAAAWYYGKERLSAPEGGLYVERARCLIASLFRTGQFVALSSAAVCWVIYSHEKTKHISSLYVRYSPLFLLLTVAMLDLGLNARRYIQFIPWKELYEKNQVAGFLKADPDIYRVRVVGYQQSRNLNDLASNILPYHQIQVVDPTSSSRLPTDYAALFDFIENRFVSRQRYYDFFNIKYVLSPQPVEESSLSFTPVAQGEGLYLSKLNHPMPRAWLTSSVVLAPDEEQALSQTLNPRLPFRDMAVVEQRPDHVPVLPLPSVISTNVVEIPVERTATLKATGSNRLNLHVKASAPSLLVVGEKWHPDWKAWVDDQPARILKTNYLMRGVEVSPGEHDIRMEYRPSTLGFKISLIGIGLLMLVGLLDRFRKSNT